MHACTITAPAMHHAHHAHHARYNAHAATHLPHTMIPYKAHIALYCRQRMYCPCTASPAMVGEMYNPPLQSVMEVYCGHGGQYIGSSTSEATLDVPVRVQLPGVTDFRNAIIPDYYGTAHTTMHCTGSPAACVHNE